MTPREGSERHCLGDHEGVRPVAGSRQEAAARTRQLLIDTGFELADSTGLSGLSVNLLVDRAGVSKGTFFHHFGNRGAYVVALHRAFHDALQIEIAGAAIDLSPGPERLEAIASTYLDVCLRQRGVRALLLEARADPAIRDEMTARNEAAGRIVAEDFRQIGSRLPAETAYGSASSLKWRCSSSATWASFPPCAPRWTTWPAALDAAWSHEDPVRSARTPRARSARAAGHLLLRRPFWTPAIERKDVTLVKTMTCRQLGGPCDLAHHGQDANQVIKAQGRHLKEIVAQGDMAHEPALLEMQGRWKHPVAGMGWYRKAKRDFAALPED